MTLCKHCQKETTNPSYCSKSCSAKQNNILYPKKIARKQTFCIICNKKLHNQAKTQFCQKCIPAELKCRFKGDVTLKEAIYQEQHRSSAYALVRTRARAIIKKLNIICCQNCGYDKHVEACHIKSIGDFDENTKLSVINDISNLKALCPNCHWEFDNLK